MPAMGTCAVTLAMYVLMFTSLQALIGNYAVPILDEKQVWGTTDETRTAYLDSLVRLLC